MSLPHIDCDCCEAARKRIAEITHAKDQENAKLHSRVAEFENAYAWAKEEMKDWTPDWWNEGGDRSYGFWDYTSQRTRDALMLFAMKLQKAREFIEMQSKCNMGLTVYAEETLKRIAPNP